MSWQVEGWSLIWDMIQGLAWIPIGIIKSELSLGLMWGPV